MSSENKGDPFGALLALTEAASSRLEKKEEETDETKGDKSSDPNKVSTPPTEATSTSTTDATDASYSALLLEKKKDSFAMVLMKMLMEDKHPDLITFLPDKKHFAVVHSKKFAEGPMPDVFGIHTYGSFTRKLLRWGFERVKERKTHEMDVFCHPLFEKGDMDKCARIKCVGHLAKAPTVMNPYPSLHSAAQQRSDAIPRGTAAMGQSSLATNLWQATLLQQQQQAQQQVQQQVQQQQMQQQAQQLLDSSMVSREFANLENFRRETEFWNRQNERNQLDQVLLEQLQGVELHQLQQLQQQEELRRQLQQQQDQKTAAAALAYYQATNNASNINNDAAYELRLAQQILQSNSFGGNPGAGPNGGFPGGF